MANNVQTIEFVRLPVGVFNAIVKSLADGTFKPIEDLPNFIPPLLSAQAAVQGIKDIPMELAIMTEPEAEAVKMTMKTSMPDVTGMDLYDLTEGMSGILSFIRLAFRKGWEKGEKSLIDDLKTGKVKVEDLGFQNPF